jgi:hypothetical protein
MYFFGRNLYFPFYGISPETDSSTLLQWKRFTRNLINDLAKGLPHKNFGSPVRVEDITLEGVGCITNLTLATRCPFYQAPFRPKRIRRVFIPEIGKQLN